MLAMEFGKGSCSLHLHGNNSKNLYHSISSKPSIQGKVFKKAPIRKTAVAMNTKSAVEGSFNYQHFHLRELRVFRGARAIISSPCHHYVTTVKAMQFNENFPVLPMEKFSKSLGSSF